MNVCAVCEFWFPEPLGVLPCIVQCCLFLGPDCSHILQGLE